MSVARIPTTTIDCTKIRSSSDSSDPALVLGTIAIHCWILAEIDVLGVTEELDIYQEKSQLSLATNHSAQLEQQPQRIQLT